MSDVEDASATPIAIDKVRASKAGHAYHEAWAARTALELLLPSTNLTAITLEGFDERDEQELGTGAVEIADLVRYHGGTNVARSHRVTAAIALTSELGRRDDLLPLLLEASLVAAGHERSDRFLYEHPDLAAVANDPEALRRLAATNVGWPGGKHSALALANAFAGDRDEARRHARRSIDWHNWAAQSRRGIRFSTTNASREWDDVGFAYVEMLAGNDVRVANFFRRDNGAAYGKFSDLLDLLERHQHSSHAPNARVAKRLLGSRIFVSKASLTSLLQASERNLVILIKLQKYHGGKSSGRGGDTSAFTHRSLIVISNKRGEVWMPQRLSQKTKLALDTLDADRRRDFYPRFRAIAGLPDEWLARRAEPPVNTEVFRLFIESLNKDDPEL